MTFTAILHELGWSKRELARRLKVRPNTVCKWGERPPAYVLAYLDLALEFQRVRERIDAALARTL